MAWPRSNGPAHRLSTGVIVPAVLAVAALTLLVASVPSFVARRQEMLKAPPKGAGIKSESPVICLGVNEVLIVSMRLMATRKGLVIALSLLMCFQHGVVFGISGFVLVVCVSQHAHVQAHRYEDDPSCFHLDPDSKKHRQLGISHAVGKDMMDIYSCLVPNFVRVTSKPKFRLNAYTMERSACNRVLTTCVYTQC